MGNNCEVLSFDVNGIKECQRNRYPLLFVDRITEATPGKSATGIKNFTYNEWFFPAHFEDEPNVPGFIQIECLVQTFIMTFLCMDEYKGKKTSFLNINNAKFHRKIVPGDRLEIKATLDFFRRGIAKGNAQGFVCGELACYAEFVIGIPDIITRFRPKEEGAV